MKHFTVWLICFEGEWAFSSFKCSSWHGIRTFFRVCCYFVWCLCRFSRLDIVGLLRRWCAFCWGCLLLWRRSIWIGTWLESLGQLVRKVDETFAQYVQLLFAALDLVQFEQAPCDQLFDFQIKLVAFSTRKGVHLLLQTVQLGGNELTAFNEFASCGRLRRSRRRRWRLRMIRWRCTAPYKITRWLRWWQGRLFRRWWLLCWRLSWQWWSLFWLLLLSCSWSDNFWWWRTRFWLRTWTMYDGWRRRRRCGWIFASILMFILFIYLKKHSWFQRFVKSELCYK